MPKISEFIEGRWGAQILRLNTLVPPIEVVEPCRVRGLSAMASTQGSRSRLAGQVPSMLHDYYEASLVPMPR